ARVPTRGFFPPTLPADLDPKASVCDHTMPPTANLAQARVLLAAKQVHVSGTSVPFYYNDEFHNKELARAVAAAWAPLGLKVVPTAVGFDELLTRGASAEGFDGAFRMAAVPD